MANFVSNDNATSLMNAINSKKDTKPVEITYAEWIALTDEERAGTHYLITDVPAQSGGGHVIENTSGTDMPQEDNLQFVGVYTEDDSTNNRTKVNIVRDMTKAQMDALSSAEKEGFIHVTDEPDNPYNSESGSGGHVIQDASGTDMNQQPNMQFVDSHVSDDSTDSRTVVENVKEVTLAELEQETERGLYLATDEDSVPIGDIDEDYVEVVAGSGETFGTLLNKLFALIDITKVNERSVLTIASDIFYPRRLQSSVLIFSGFRVLDTNAYYESAYIKSSESSLYLATYIKSSGSWNIEEETASEVVSGKKFTLYYGNSSGIVELNTDASHCMMSDGVTSVEQALTTNTISETETVTPSVGQSVYKDFVMPNDGKKYICTVTVALGTSKSAKAEMWAGGSALLSSIAAIFINVSDMPIDCAQTMTLFANGNGGNLRVYIWTHSTDCDTYTIKLNAISI